ncbi:Protein of unknown function [Bacillus wiedmannii]|nr:Protein of unknown function [Bacillus wiedmannii]
MMERNQQDKASE